MERRTVNWSFCAGAGTKCSRFPGFKFILTFLLHWPPGGILRTETFAEIYCDYGFAINTDHVVLTKTASGPERLSWKFVFRLMGR